MMKCPECGNEVAKTDAICGSCGCPLENEDVCDNAQRQSEEPAVVRFNSTHTNTSVSDMPNKKGINKLAICLSGVIGVMAIALIALGMNGSKTRDAYEKQVKELTANIEKQKALLESTEKDNKNLSNSLSELQASYDEVESEYKAYKEEMKPYEEMETAEAEQRKAEAEAQQREAKNQEIATEAVEKVWNFEAGTLQEGATKDLCAKAREAISALTDEAKKTSLSEAVKAAEDTIAAKEQEAAAREAQGYETGITYDQLARTPDDFIGQKCKFSGRVLQTQENDGAINIRIAVDGNSDNVIYGMYDKNIISSRILDDDYITVYGTALGIASYTSVMGAEISIPAMTIDKIDQ